MGEAVVSVRDLSKRFKIYKNPWHRALEWSSMGRRRMHADFWALRDIGFEVKKGECLGVIGPNGAGKSTLLKILTGALYPTSGTFSIRGGRVLSLLELGTGFNGELTGRQNIRQSARMMNFPEGFVEGRMSEIEEFAELGEFFDRPIKMYSSGMYVRLAFSMFAHMEPQVLIVDEALSVGDIFFKQKCHARMEGMLKGGTTFLFVTHDMGAVEKYCTSAMVLNKGEAVFLGTSQEAIRRYLSLHRRPKAGKEKGAGSEIGVESPLLRDDTGQMTSWPGEDAFIDLSSASVIGEGWALCTAVALCDADGNPKNVFKFGETAVFYHEFEALKDLQAPYGVVALMNEKNIVVHGKATYQHSATSFQKVKKGTRIRIRQGIVLNLTPQQYTFDVVLDMLRPEDYARLGEMTASEIQGKVMRLVHVHQAGSFHIIPPTDKPVQWTHFGMCDLPGDAEISLSMAGVD